MSQDKTPVTEALDFNEGGNSAKGKQEIHDSPKAAADGIKSKRSPDKE